MTGKAYIMDGLDFGIFSKGDLLHCSHNVLKGPEAGCGAGDIPHCDAA